MITRLAIAAVWLAPWLAACDRDPSTRSTAPGLAPPPVTARPPAPFTHTAGVVVTAHDIFLDGTPLGLDPARLTDPAPLAPIFHTTSSPLDALGYTPDAPAPAVLAALHAMFLAGRPEVAITGALADGDPAASGDGRGDACLLSSTPTSRPLDIVIDRDTVHLGLNAARPVLAESLADRGLIDQLQNDVVAPFFRKPGDTVDSIRLYVAPGTTGDDLRRVLRGTCDARPLHAIAFGDYAQLVASHTLRTLPRCRTVLAADGSPDDALRSVMPSLDAMDLCYGQFEPHPTTVGQLRFAFDRSPEGFTSHIKVTGLDRDVNACLAWLLGHRPLSDARSGPHTHFAGTVECNLRCCNGD